MESQLLSYSPSQVPLLELTLRLTGSRPLTAVQVEKLFDAAQEQHGSERYSVRVHQQDPYRFVLILVPTPETEAQERVAAQFRSLLEEHELDCELDWSQAGAKPVEPMVEHEIARRAYELWEARGRPWGSAEQDWFRAEAEVRARPNHMTYLGAPPLAASA